MDPENVVGTIKIGGEGVNFFGSFSFGKVGILEKIEGTLTG